MTDKAQENRVRRKAARHDLMLRRSRRRNPDAPDYGKYALLSIDTNVVIYGLGSFGFDADLDEIEEWLDAPETD